jgi:O-antigen/teichoic acid export membrane protein
MVSYAAGPALGLLSGPVLAYALGPVGRGQFASVMQPITVAGALAALGIPSAVAVFSARGAYDPAQSYRLGMLLAVVPTLLVFAGLALYAPQVARAQHLDTGFVIGAWVLVIGASLVQVRRGFWQGIAGWGRLDLERLLFAVLRFAALVVVALLGIRLAEAYVAAALGAFVVAALVVYWPDRARDGIHAVRGAARPPTRAFTVFSASSAVGTVAAVANNRLDQVLMPAQISSAQIGYYAIAVTVAEVPLVLIALASRNALQAASAGFPVRAIWREIRIFVVTGVVALVVLAAAADLYVPVFFGADFASSIAPVRVLSIGTLFAMAGMVASAVITGYGRPFAASLLALSGLVVTVVLFAVFWGEVGSLAAAWIATASQAVAIVVGAVVVIVLWARRARQAHDAGALR